MRNDREVANQTFAVTQMAEPLLEWYDRGHRNLPWREDPTPYHVWISEIMLQQTRVEAVKSYYYRFMEELPTVEALARVPVDRLLKLWEGLGYYSRARNLQAAAIRICEEYDGKMPGTFAELCKLPGIGMYTAAAVSSIGFGEREPAVDGNVLRVMARLREDERCISEEQVKKAVRAELQEAIPDTRPGDYNQAMMELGACVCVPNGEPHCTECPFEKSCLAHLHGTEMRYPVKAAKKERRTEEKTMLVLRDGNKVAIRKRPDRGLLAGLYELPSLEGYKTPDEVQRYLDSQGLKVLRIKAMGPAKHIFSHIEWHMIGYFVRVDELERYLPGSDAAEWIYVEPEETKERYSIPSAFAFYAAELRGHLE